MTRLGTDADVCGASLFSDGATAKHVPLINLLGASVVCPPVMLEILDCRDHIITAGQQAVLQMGSVEKRKVDLFFIDGASNMQVVGAVPTLKLPTITCVHAAEHVVALVFSDITKIPAVQKLIRGSPVVAHRSPCSGQRSAAERGEPAIRKKQAGVTRGKAGSSVEAPGPKQPLNYIEAPSKKASSKI